MFFPLCSNLHHSGCGGTMEWTGGKSLVLLLLFPFEVWMKYQRKLHAAGDPRKGRSVGLVVIGATV